MLENILIASHLYWVYALYILEYATGKCCKSKFKYLLLTYLLLFCSEPFVCVFETKEGKSDMSKGREKQFQFVAKVKAMSQFPHNLKFL